MSSIASRVELPPAPAMMGTRPAACCTETRITSQCSSTETVGDSPVVPTTPMQSVPSSMCQSIRRRKASKSTLPSSCIGVTSATMLPRMGFMRVPCRTDHFSWPAMRARRGAAASGRRPVRRQRRCAERGAAVHPGFRLRTPRCAASRHRSSNSPVRSRNSGREGRRRWPGPRRRSRRAGCRPAPPPRQSWPKRPPQVVRDHHGIELAAGRGQGPDSRSATIASAQPSAPPAQSRRGRPR